MHDKLTLQIILGMTALTLSVWAQASAQVSKAVVQLPQAVSAEHIDQACSVLRRLPFVAQVVPSPALEKTARDHVLSRYRVVPLSERYFEVTAKKGQSLNYARMTQALRSAGFTPRCVQLTVSGTLGAQQDKIVLTVANGSEKFALEEYRCKDKSGPMSTKRARTLRELLAAAQQGKRIKAVTGCVIASEVKKDELLTLGVMGFAVAGEEAR